MHHSNRTNSVLSLLLAALGASACVLGPDIIGETFPNGSGDPVDTSGGDTSSGPGTVGTTADVPAGAPYNAPCELAGVGPEIQSTQVVAQPACEGGICLFLAENAKVACETDEFCSTQWMHDVCGTNGFCNIAQEAIDDGAKCTQACADDSDCPEIPGCMEGAACLPVATEGPFCCQRICACLDQFGTETLQARLTACADPEGTCG